MHEIQTRNPRQCQHRDKETKKNHEAFIEPRRINPAFLLNDHQPRPTDEIRFRNYLDYDAIQRVVLDLRQTS